MAFDVKHCMWFGDYLRLYCYPEYDNRKSGASYWNSIGIYWIIDIFALITKKEISMQESKEQKEECRAMALRIKLLSDSIKSHAIELITRDQPATNTTANRIQLGQLFNNRWDLALSVFETAKRDGTLVSSDRIKL